MAVLIVVFAGCSRDLPNGPVQVKLIQPTGSRCQYQIKTAQLNTLQSLRHMQGTIGRVVTSAYNVQARTDILDKGSSFEPIEVSFSSSGNTYVPLDYQTLLAVSLYYSIERSHLLFSRLDTLGDLSKIVPNFSDTLIVQNAIRSDEFGPHAKELTDNAEYFPNEVTNGSSRLIRNYFFSFPTETDRNMPLGLNLGIMTHEYTHMVFNYLFYEPALARYTTIEGKKPTMETLISLEEGMGDYFGFLATQDPGYFDCSFPGLGRDLVQARAFSADVAESLLQDEDFDPHVPGSIWASINFRIGEKIGHEANAQLLIRLMKHLLDCKAAGAGSNNLDLDFASVAACHSELGGSAAPVIRQVYNQYLGVYGGIR